MRSHELRKSFLKYFEKQDHRILPGSSLVPIDDPTLLYINAGMNQFKRIFLGEEERPCSRAATVQKCLRVSGKHNDLEEVGRDEHHHTFFEMLGNWSFGDYYKAEAIEFAWEYLTGLLGLEKDRLWVTVHERDDETLELWPKITGLPPSRVLKFGDKDNFWEMGEVGPCGPCTEMHYDFGSSRGAEFPESGPNDPTSDRWVELWNLVFIQYSRQPDGTLQPLSKRYVDTGLGFERLLALLQGVPGNYGTDLFTPIMHHVGELTGGRHSLESQPVAFRAIADHIRTLSFAISDGVMPSNEGRGYVLRRILRRAARYGRILGLEGPFLHSLSTDVVKIMGVDYPELEETAVQVAKIIEAEERNFGITLDRGLALFEKEARRLQSRGETAIPPEVIFKLYDTYGFPPDLTHLMAEEEGLSVSMEGFRELMDGQRESSRTAAQFAGITDDMPELLLGPAREGVFVGYQTFDIYATVGATEPPEGIGEGETGWIVLTENPFYPEGGGQVWDLGTIEAEGLSATVLEVRKSETAGSVIRVEVQKGRLETGASVGASVDSTRRIRVQAHHTATHLLHAALRQVLGTHVRQSGSLVAPDRLRFDFTHYQAVSREELDAIEKTVNTWVDADLPVTVEEDVSLEDAKAAGALAFFGEKYSEAVRVVSIPGVSMELCGGTHMNRTSRVGPFRLTSESGIAAGVRRVEAVSGGALLERYVQLERTTDSLSLLLGGTPEEAPTRAARLKDRLKELEQELEASKAALHKAKMGGMMEHRVESCSARVIGGVLSSANRKELRAAADKLREEHKRTVAVLATREQDRVHLLVAITDDLLSEGVHAGRIVGILAQKLGGRGGGRAHLAEAGAKIDGEHAAVLQDLPRFVADVLERGFCQ